MGGVGGLGGGVVGVVEHDLIFVGVAKEDPGDDVGRESIDNLVEEVGGVGERVGTVPAGEDVGEDPDAFVGGFGGEEFFGQEFEDAGNVGVGGVDEVCKWLSARASCSSKGTRLTEVVVAIPEVAVDGDDSKIRVRGIYSPSVLYGI